MPLFVPKRDIQFLRGAQANLYAVAFNRYQVFKRNRSVASYDSLYKEERPEDYLTGESFMIPCFFRMNPQQAELTRFGIAEKRDVKVTFSTEVLHRGWVPSGTTQAVPFPWPDVGDFIIIQGETYVFTDIKPIDYFGVGVDTPLSLEAFGLKTKPLANPGATPGLQSEDFTLAATSDVYRDRDIYGE